MYTDKGSFCPLFLCSYRFETRTQTSKSILLTIFPKRRYNRYAKSKRNQSVS